MAQKVEEFPQLRDRSPYPWDQWLDGGIWELTQGDDFKGTPAAFRANARARAVRRGGSLRARIVTDDDGPDKVYLQFHTGPEE